MGFKMVELEDIIQSRYTNAIKGLIELIILLSVANITLLLTFICINESFLIIMLLLMNASTLVLSIPSLMKLKYELG